MKVTHARRPYTAKTARENGATANGVKALGGWSEGGSYRQCYDRGLPVDALLGAAMFNSKKPEEHFLPREHLGVCIFLMTVLPIIYCLLLQILQLNFWLNCSHGSKRRLPSSPLINVVIDTRKMLPFNIS
jgi:hypothetical protein